MRPTALTPFMNHEAYLFRWALRTIDASIIQHIRGIDGPLPKSLMDPFLAGLAHRTGFKMTTQLLEHIILNATHRETAPVLHDPSIQLLLALKRLLLSSSCATAARHLRNVYLAWSLTLTRWLELHDDVCC
jgi:hypothetical protein